MASDEYGGGLLTAIVASIISVIGSIVTALLTHRWKLENEQRLETLRREFDDKKRRLQNAENIEELMKQYKKPLIQSAFELQSRLKEQISRNLLHLFSIQGEERRAYVFLSTMYLFCEFLGWLEIVRREVVFITGRKAEMLNQILDDIKFQFTGETIIQGVTNWKQTTDEFGDKKLFLYKWSVMQVLGVELRAIGEAMIKHRTYDDQKPNQANTGLEVIGFNEFVLRHNGNWWTIMPPDSAGGTAEAQVELNKMPMFKVAFKPLAKSVARLMELRNGQTPKERITMLQVLLCKLIDILDDGGQQVDDGPGGQFLSRNHRITPMVAKLTPPALKWLAERPYMEDCKDTLTKEDYETWCHLTMHTDTAKGWWEDIEQEMKIYNTNLQDKENGMQLTPFDKKYCKDLTMKDLAKLTFPGFRADIGDFSKSKEELGGAWFPGAFPPRQPRSTSVALPAQSNSLNTSPRNTTTTGVNGKQHAD